MKKEGFLIGFLYVGIFIYLMAFIVHFFFQSFIADLSLWNFSSGWQREIALFNVAVIFLGISALVKKEEKGMRLVALFLIALSILLGANHIISQLLAQQLVLLHTVGAVVHVVVILFGIYALKS